MTKRMLVDASHQEETRVVILDGTKVEEFDYESASRRPLKGNIYLAKVTRVEPSLQACFVEYGGNRHGFLAFSEIHPDYYQIPTADRQALLEASRSMHRDADDDVGDDDGPHDVREVDHDEIEVAEVISTVADEDATQSSVSEPVLSGEIVEIVGPEADDVWVHDPETGTVPSADDVPSTSLVHSEQTDASGPLSSGQGVIQTELETQSETSVDESSDSERKPKPQDDDAHEEVPRRQHRSFRRYKIQEVIKRRQVLLIQVVKEERGNKGAALTTYLSLAGRYCVLMPNTDRGGGISRKISNVADRRKLKEMAGELEVPEGMGVIIRTAGANRTKQEIRRDFEYLLRQWDSVRDLTLRSSAPTLVYEEGNLIKRTIRDLFSKEIDEILVEGDLGFNEAHGFMTMLMPSHADNVKNYKDSIPLYQRYGVETALDSMFNPTVRLRSGGYIVINQTEALVAVDVNSGKSTREHHIEDTALKTNLEAAEEIARQLRLRDLAGLVVIDFIDMEEHRNNRSVEKRLKDCLRHDRARIQLGRISPFGLLEMSRQRLRAGIIEGATTACPHCEGRGVIRSVGSMALRVLRAVEEYCQHERSQAVTLRVPPEVALYILNHKRTQLTAIEDRNGVYIYIESQLSLAASAYEIERGSAVAFEPRKPAAEAVTVESELETNEAYADEADDDENDAEAPRSEEGDDAGPAAVSTSPNENGDVRRKRRRRRRGRDRDREPRVSQSTDAERKEDHLEGDAVVQLNTVEGGVSHDLVDTDQEDGASEGDEEFADDGDPNTSASPIGSTEPLDGQRRRRRRGRRGRRGKRFGENGNSPQQQGNGGIGNLPTPAQAFDAPDWPASGGISTTPGPAHTYSRPSKAFEPYSSMRTADAPIPDEIQERTAEAKPERASIASFFGFGPKTEKAEPVRQEEVAVPDSPEQAKKRGWWQKKDEG